MSYTWPVTVAEAKLHLGTAAGTDDAELSGFIDAMTALVEYLTGPISATTYTEFYDGGHATITLRRLPVVSVTSITEYQGNNVVALTEAADPSAATSGLNFTLEKPTGLVTRVSGPGWAYPFFVGSRNIKVVYVAGFAVVPANVRWAALELVRANWVGTQNSRGGLRHRNDDGQMLMGYFVPNNVRETLLPNERLPGIG